jgi:hypothetical protein
MSDKRRHEKQERAQKSKKKTNDIEYFARKDKADQVR